MTKLKIDIRNGTLEVEGEESFVKEVYNDYKEKLDQNRIPPAEKPLQDNETSKIETRKEKTIKGPAKTVSKRKDSYQIVKDLDLSAKGGKEALKEFYTKKSPKNGLQKNAVFVYYLAKIANKTSIDQNHIYTCYKDVNEKVPGALRQSLLDTSFKKGWIDTKSMDEITITVQGENLIEHELPPKKDEK